MPECCDLKSEMFLDSVWLSDHFRIELSQVIGTTVSAVSPMERDEFTALFDQEFLWSEERSHLGFMKCSWSVEI